MNMNTITGWQIYWLTRCDSIKELLTTSGGFAAMTIISMFLFTLMAFIVCCQRDEIRKLEKRYGTEDDTTIEAKYQMKLACGVRRLSLWLFGFFGVAWLGCKFICPLVPTTKEMAAIVVIPKVANSESVQGLGEGVVSLARDWMEELRPKNVRETVKTVATAVKDAHGAVGKDVKDVIREVTTPSAKQPEHETMGSSK